LIVPIALTLCFIVVLAVALIRDVLAEIEDEKTNEIRKRRKANGRGVPSDGMWF